MKRKYILIGLIVILIAILIYMCQALYHIKKTRASLYEQINKYQETMYELGDTTSEGR